MPHFEFTFLSLKLFELQSLLQLVLKQKPILVDVYVIFGHIVDHVDWVLWLAMDSGEKLIAELLRYTWVATSVERNKGLCPSQSWTKFC